MASAGAIEPDFSARRIVAVVWTGAFLASLAVFLKAERPDVLVTGTTLAIGSILLLIAIRDERTFLIPDRLVLALCAIAVGVHLWRDPDQLRELAVAGAIGFGFVWAVRVLYQVFRGEPGVGLGDAKLFGATGLLVGVEGLIGTLLWAVSTGLLLCAGLILLGRLNLRQGARIAFGSHLAFGAWMVWLWGPLLPGAI